MTQKGLLVQPVPPALSELSNRLRQLREERWPDIRLTQAALGQALGGEKALSVATISSWESPTSPKVPPRARVRAYAIFFATRRSAETMAVLPLDSFTEAESAAYKELEAELIGLREAARKPALGEKAPVRGSWSFADRGPATFICAQLPGGETVSLADPSNPNYTELLSYADLDALVELHGHIRAENPAMDVFYKTSSNVVPDDLSGHLILLGGIAWNEKTARFAEMTDLPVRQVEDPSVTTGEVFVVTVDGHEHKFLPTWGDRSQTELREDVGLLARAPNPLNSSRTLTICNGIHSRGVLGAVRSLTDARLRDSNERYIATNFGSSSSFVLVMRVPVFEGEAMTPDFSIKGSVLYQGPVGDKQTNPTVATPFPAKG